MKLFGQNYNGTEMLYTYSNYGMNLTKYLTMLPFNNLLNSDHMETSFSLMDVKIQKMADSMRLKDVIYMQISSSNI